jgi:Na+-driven multidrug efflux pump
MASVKILQVLVWFVMFSYMGSVRNIWILAEGKQSILWKINLTGALVNVILNLFLIPWLGAVGAAIASLVTQIVANFVFGFIAKTLRPNNKLLLKGLNPKLPFEILKILYHRIQSGATIR